MSSSAPRFSSASRVCVVGGGLAGIAASVILAERGVPVTLFEAERYLGGRVGAWPDRLADGTPFQMERGFHAFFRNYRNLRRLLARVDPQLRRLVFLRDYPLLGPHGARESFADLPRTTPLNLIELVRRTPSLTMRDLLGVHVGSALEMLRFDPERTYAKWDDRTARAYLDGLRFPPGARRMLFEVFAHSFFNPEDEYSAAELLAMFHFYFLGNPEGLPFDVMDRPFSEAFIDPLADHLRAHGAQLHVGTRVERIARDDGGWLVQAGGEPTRCDGLVLALDVGGLKSLAARSADALLPKAGDGPLGSRLLSQIEGLATTAPFAVLRLFLDRPMPAGAAPFAGTAGVGILDNISVYDRLETESKAIASARNGSVVELHAYGLDRGAREPEIREGLLAGLFAIRPELEGARVLEDRFLLRQDCPAFAPGSHRARPTVRTPIASLALAGDFVKLPFASALMERAASSGMMAANVHLERLGLPTERIETGPQRGILRPGILLQRDAQGGARPW